MSVNESGLLHSQYILHVHFVKMYFCNFTANRILFSIIQAQDEPYTYKAGSNELPGSTDG